MANFRIDMDAVDAPTREAIMVIVKKYCEDRGIVYPDEWGFSTLLDVGIDFGLTVDMRD